MNAPRSPVDLLCNLIRIPSVNPMGRPFEGDEFLEHALTDYLEKWFQQQGVEPHRTQVHPGRHNLVAVLPGHGSDKVIVFEAHQDTVPVDGMSIPPWSPQVTEGRVSGRGACDIKGGMACMLTAFQRLSESNLKVRPTVIMACTVDEEHGFTGARHLTHQWQRGEHPLVPRLPDVAIVAEPTELQVVVAHKGVVRWRCHTHGRAAHSSQPESGANAIYQMATVLEALKDYAEIELAQFSGHPLLGQPTLSVGMIRGGISVNTVPDLCTIEIDRRVLPGEDPFAARAHVIETLEQRISADRSLEHEAPFLATSALTDARNERLAESLDRVARQHGGGNRIGVPYGTDAPAFDGVGIPTVVFGPGSIEQAHTSDEWIAVDQLERATDIYYQFACELSR